MANYNTVTSMGFSISPKEKEFLERVSAGMEDARETGEYDDDATLDDLPTDPYELGRKLVACSEDPGVNIDIDTSGKTVVLSDDMDGTANPNGIKILLGAMLDHSGSNDVIGFQYADTCSRPRVDAFGGGAAAVSRDTSDEEHTSAALDRLSKKVLNATQGVKGIIRPTPSDD